MRRATHHIAASPLPRHVTPARNLLILRLYLAPRRVTALAPLMRPATAKCARQLLLTSLGASLSSHLVVAMRDPAAAKRAIEWLPESDAKSALYMMVDYVLSCLS